MEGGKEGIVKRRNRSINEKQEKRYIKSKKKEKEKEKETHAALWHSPQQRHDLLQWHIVNMLMRINARYSDRKQQQQQ